MRTFKWFGACLFVCIIFIAPILAHPGGTDGAGGHRNRSTGEYHYHHGYSAHQHIDGECPYDFDDRTGLNSGSPSNDDADSQPNKNNDTAKGSWASRGWNIFAVLSFVFFGLPLIVFFVWLLISYVIYKIKEKKNAELRRAEAERRRKESEVEAARRKEEMLLRMAQERQRFNDERDKYQALYGGKKIEDIVCIPSGVEIGEDGLPKQTNTKGWGSKFTFYASGSKDSPDRSFHKKRGCSSATFKLHACQIGSRKPCRRCCPQHPDLQWFQEYRRIQEIKKKYSIDQNETPE